MQQLHFCNFKECTAFALDFDLDFFLYIFGQHLAIIILCYHLTRCYGQGFLPSHASKLKKQIKVDKNNVLVDSTHYPNNNLSLSEMNKNNTTSSIAIILIIGQLGG